MAPDSRSSIIKRARIAAWSWPEPAAEVPIYRSTGTDMIVNLKSAKALGIAVPQAIIDQASSLIQ
jgi:hypothetical protein